METPKFGNGELVQRCNQPESTGVVRESRWNSQVERWEYKVQFGAQLVGLPEAMLQALRIITSPWDALQTGQFSGRDHFISALTHERLLHPSARIVNSFATARTRFYPYQFKPLLKFLEHPGKRLLIADDVGLGKTIEAGYILRELDARSRADRILVLAPARLATKWRRELELRFDESFVKATGKDLIEQTQRLTRGQDLDRFRWIVSYESVRPAEVRQAIEETRLPIDILIVDEAHRMRNSDSQQHKIGQLLSACSDAVIFLSATPVMNRLEDLWQLLRLLSPEEFELWQVFRERIQSNQFILAAQRALSVQPPDLANAKDNIDAFASYMQRYEPGPGEFLASVQNRLQASPKSRRELIELQSDVGRLSPVGHVISRTRKVDAIADRPERSAHWQSVELNETEQEVYDSVAALCREAGMGGTSSWGFEMSLLMAYRATASCIPAAIDYFSERIQSNRPVDVADFEEEGEEFEEGAETLWSGPVRARFRTIIDAYKAEHPPDSKYAALRHILGEVWRDDSKARRQLRKVVLFSFFRGTLNYLTRRLSKDGIANRMIHGGVPLADRDVAIDEFLTTKDLQVLLTSEVGGEGIDLVEASVVINYDLPWNPMVVEQRIGRVDRIGQEAKRIIIHNLIVKGSVEERVLARLLSKIAVFLQTIGDLEPIVGEQIETLTAKAITGELTDDEIKSRIDEQARILDRTRNDAMHVLAQADGLLAADQSLIDEIEALTEERQVPSQDELFLYLNRFLAEHYPGRQLPQNCTRDLVTVDLTGDLAADVEMAGYELGTDVMIFGRSIGKGPVEITLSRDAAYRRPRAELIHLQHPLARFASSKLRSRGDQFPSAFRLAIRSKAVPPGPYAFLVASIDIQGQRKATRLVCFLCSRKSGEISVDPDVTSAVLVGMLRDGEDIYLDAPGTKEVVSMQGRLSDGLHQLIAQWEARESKLDLAREERLRISQLAVLQLRRRRAESTLKRLKESSAAQPVIRMWEGQFTKAKREEQEFLETPKRSNWGGIAHREVAVGLLEVKGEAR